MVLPQTVTDFLKQNAENNGATPPTAGENLFKTGVLDSFALVDFVAVLETECGIKVPDADIIPDNFQTIDAIDNYVRAHQV